MGGRGGGMVVVMVRVRMVVLLLFFLVSRSLFCTLLPFLSFVSVVDAFIVLLSFCLFDESFESLSHGDHDLPRTRELANSLEQKLFSCDLDGRWTSKERREEWYEIEGGRLEG